MPPINPRTLEKLTRAEIQRLAVANGIKANVKTAHIITQLRRLGKIIAPKDEPSASTTPQPRPSRRARLDVAVAAVGPSPQVRRSRRLQAGPNAGVTLPRIPTTIREEAQSRRPTDAKASNGQLTEILGRLSPALSLAQGEPVTTAAARPINPGQSMSTERARQQTQQLRASHGAAVSGAALSSQQHLDAERLERLRTKSRALPLANGMIKDVATDMRTQDACVPRRASAEPATPQEIANERKEHIDRRHKLYRQVKFNPREDRLQKPRQKDIDRMGQCIQDVAEKFAGLEQLVRDEHAKTGRLAALLVNLQSKLDAEGGRRERIVPFIQGFQPLKPTWRKDVLWTAQPCQDDMATSPSQGGSKRRHDVDDADDRAGPIKRPRGATQAAGTGLGTARELDAGTPTEGSAYINEFDAQLVILRRRVFDNSAAIQDYEGNQGGEVPAAGASSHEMPSNRPRRAPSPGSNRAADIAHLLPKTPEPTLSPRVSKGKRRQRDEDVDTPEELQGPTAKRPRMTPKPAAAPAPSPETPLPDVPYKGKGKEREVLRREPSPEPSGEEPESVAEARREPVCRELQETFKAQAEQDACSAAVIRQLVAEDPTLPTFTYAQLDPADPQLQVEAARVAGPSVPPYRGDGQVKRRRRGG